MHGLLRFLAEHRPEAGRFHNWQFQRISDSANNLLYHATSNTADLAIKFAIRDARHVPAANIKPCSLSKRAGPKAHFAG